jgi:hypothetical protein
MRSPRPCLRLAHFAKRYGRRAANYPRAHAPSAPFEQAQALLGRVTARARRTAERHTNPPASGEAQAREPEKLRAVLGQYRQIGGNSHPHYLQLESSTGATEVVQAADAGLARRMVPVASPCHSHDVTTLGACHNVGPSMSGRRCRAVDVGPSMSGRRCRAVDVGPSMSGHRCRVVDVGSSMSGRRTHDWAPSRPCSAVTSASTYRASRRRDAGSTRVSAYPLTLTQGRVNS